jgi:2',3'-cyclic-nucleotide 2'-phosphodiesterase (5'-nucleotidase family)
MNMLDDALQAITDHKKELVAVVVHLNDTYLIDARPKRQLPGFARITATIKRLRSHIKNETGSDLLLVVHSGDFLSPSLVGRDDQGATMVELLNMAGVQYCVLGNHEFDDGAKVLAQRLKEAEFEVLLANAVDRTGCIDPSEMGRHVVWRANGDQRPRVALTGVVSADVHKSFASPDPDGSKEEKVPWNFTSPNEAVIQVWNDIKDDEDDASKPEVAFTTNIPFRIVLTHGTQDEDRQLRRQTPDTPRTYILGGHDHDIEYVDGTDEVLIMKNLANAETMRVMLLLAGGKSIVDEVDAACARLQARQRRPLRYPRDLEAVLLTVSDLDREVLRDRIKKAAPVGWCRNLRKALNKAPTYLDNPTFVLRYDDHEEPDEKAKKIIQDAIKKVGRTGDDNDVCDFTGK